MCFIKKTQLRVKLALRCVRQLKYDSVEICFFFLYSEHRNCRNILGLFRFCGLNVWSSPVKKSVPVEDLSDVCHKLKNKDCKEALAVF